MPDIISIKIPKDLEFPGFVTAAEIVRILPMTRQGWERYATSRNLQMYEAVTERPHRTGPKRIRMWRVEDVLSYQTQRKYQAATPAFMIATTEAKRVNQQRKRNSAKLTAERVQIVPPTPAVPPPRPPKAPPATVKPVAAPARPSRIPPAPPALQKAPPPRPPKTSSSKASTSADMDRLLAQTNGDVHKIAAAIYPDQFWLRTQRPSPSVLAD